MENQKKNAVGFLWLLPWLFVASVPFGLGLLLWLSAHCQLGDNPSMSTLGEYGSYLQGSVASLWALAGVILVGGAFYAQAKQLNLQGEQLETQREDSKRQFQLTYKQGFESSFFQLLNMLNQTVSQMRIHVRKVINNVATTEIDIIEGKACFAKWFEDFRTRFRLQVQGESFLENINPDEMRVRIKTLEFAQSCYKLFAKETKAFNHYLRTLFCLLEFIDRSSMGDLEKERYANLVAAQLSSNESALLFYQTITYTDAALSLLINKFHLLALLDEKTLVLETHINFDSRPPEPEL